MSLRTLKIDDNWFQCEFADAAREHPAQAALCEATRTNPHAGIRTGPDPGQCMAWPARLPGARHTIEIDSFTGNCTLAVALARLGDGRVPACDIGDEYPRIGRPFWRQAGMAHWIEPVLAPALQTLDARLAAGEAGGDVFALLDADEATRVALYERCLALLRPLACTLHAAPCGPRVE